tara:strand:- start:154 stop:789 length:636 start_codon:yes stop_codon:yes gene_type:complete
MSFRKEIKSTLNDGKISILIKWIFKNNGKVLFPERVVNSIYFDNKNLNMYFESVEGVLPRKKIRLRLYNSENYLKNFLNNTNLELKISSVEGRYKISKRQLIKGIKKNQFSINDKDYGLCKPVLNVTYLRTYYKINGIRLTIDRKINYKKIKFSRILPYSIQDKLNVVELKYSNSELDNKILDLFPFQFNRFSKYCRGIEFTQKKHCDENI